MARRKDYTIFQGRAGDHNDLAIPGALALGTALCQQAGARPVIVGTPAPALNTGWRTGLDAAMPDLRMIQTRIDAVLASGAASIAATSRCAVSLATLPPVARHHPDACVVWFDSHADLNTPESTTTGYLGGLAFAGPAGLWESGLGAGLRLEQIVLVGQHDLDPFEQDLIDRHGIPHVKPGAEIASQLRSAISGRPVYVHLDCDVLNPGIVPTDYVHDGGLSLEDLHLCASVLADHDVIGLETAELQISWTPEGPPVSPTPLLGALAPLL